MLNDLWAQVLAWSGALVAPDWGGLVRLIPLLLLVVVVAFLAITAVKWATLVPAATGRRRRLPLTGDGRPLRSPVVGPLVVAGGIFALAFGLLAGGPWPAVGAATVLAGLAAWWAEARHVPRPSAPRVSGARLGIVAAIAVLVVVLIATARLEPDLPNGAPGIAAQGAGATASAVPTASALPTAGAVPTADATLTARGITFVDPGLTAPAGRPFTVAFDNRDSVPHNLEIRGADGSVLFQGDFVTGPVVTVYDVPALPAGAYQFICTVHPAMTGTLTVK